MRYSINRGSRGRSTFVYLHVIPCTYIDTIQSIVAIHLYVTSKSYFNPLSKATFSKVYWNRVSPAFT